MGANRINFLASAAIGSLFVFIPLIAKDMGATDMTIGLIMAVYGATNMLSFFIFGRLSDTVGRKIFIMLGLGMSTLAFFAHILANSVMSLLIIRALAGFSVGVYPAALTAYVWERKKRLGKFTSYASLGWGVGALIAGIIASYKGMFLITSVLFFISFLISVRLPFVKELHHKVPFFPKELIRQNLPIYLPFSLRHLGANMVWTIFPLYLLGLGATVLWVGIINFTNSAMQFVIMRRIERKREKMLIRVGLASSALAFLSLSFATHYAHALLIMLMVGVSWATLYMGSVTYLAKSNVEKATAVGILNSTLSLCNVLGPLLGGIIAQLYGYKAVMLVAAFLSLAGLGAAKIERSGEALNSS